MNIEQVKTAGLTAYERNAKQHPQDQVDKIAASIKEFGFNQPLVITKDNVVIVGHGRLLAALALGMDSVPCIRREDLTESQIRAYRLADNKLNESGWDMGMVADELKLLDGEGFDTALTGFSKDDFQDVEEDDFDVDQATEDSKETDIKLGDMFQLGSHRLLCGDATKTEDYLKLLDNGNGLHKIDMVFTDPPYNVDYKGGSLGKREVIKNDKMSPEKFLEFLKSVMANLVTFTRGAFYICISNAQLHNFYRAFTEAGGHWQTYIIWAKDHFTLSRTDHQQQTEPIMYGLDDENEKRLSKENFEEGEADSLPIMYGWTQHEWYGGRKQGNVWFFERPRKSKEHPTMKPLKLCARAIKNSSTIGGGILDVFGGSGSTLLACEQLNRKCFMMELDPVYVAVIIKRWEEYTGGEVTKL